MTAFHDAGAYLLGRKIGRHPMAKRTSPGQDLGRLPRRARLVTVAASCAVLPFIHPFDAAARAQAVARDVRDDADRRSRRVARQARPRREGHGKPRPGPRRVLRPHRRRSSSTRRSRTSCCACWSGRPERSDQRSRSSARRGRSARRPSTSSTARRRVHACTRSPANSDVDAIAEQIERFHPRASRWPTPTPQRRSASGFPDVDVLDGDRRPDRARARSDADVVLNAVVGAAGLQATLAALDAGRLVALANKESCIAGGPLVARRLARARDWCPSTPSTRRRTCVCGARTCRCASIARPDGVGRAVPRQDARTSSRRHRRRRAAPSDVEHGAEDHHRLGDVDEQGTRGSRSARPVRARFRRHRRRCHPQSVIHCLVGFADGSWKASLGSAGHACADRVRARLSRPPRLGSRAVDWASMRRADLRAGRHATTFRCVALAYEAGRTGGTAPAVLNAANEVAVAAFLDGRLASCRSRTWSSGR